MNGTINPDPEVVVAAGNDATITYKPNTGYEISEITIDGKVIDIKGHENGYTFTNVTENHHIKVVYTIKNVETGLFEVGAVLLIIVGIAAGTFIYLKKKRIKAI